MKEEQKTISEDAMPSIVNEELHGVAIPFGSIDDGYDDGILFRNYSDKELYMSSKTFNANPETDVYDHCRCGKETRALAIRHQQQSENLFVENLYLRKEILTMRAQQLHQRAFSNICM